MYELHKAYLQTYGKSGARLELRNGDSVIGQIEEIEDKRNYDLLDYLKDLHKKTDGSSDKQILKRWINFIQRELENGSGVRVSTFYKRDGL